MGKHQLSIMRLVSNLKNNKKYYINLSSSYGVILVNIIIPILLTPYLLDKLGGELYGLWVLLSSIIVYFQLSNFGMTTTYLKEISKELDFIALSKHTSTTFFFFLFIILIMAIVFTFVLSNLENIFLIDDNLVNTAKTVFLVLFFIFGLNLIASIFDSILFAKGFLYLKNTIAIITTMSSAILTYLVLDFGYSLVEISFIHLGVAMTTLTIYFLISLRITTLKISFKYFDYKLLQSFLKPSVYYFIISVSIMISFYSDSLIISSFIGLTAVAIYSVAFKIINLSEKILFKIVDIMFPDISKLFQEKKYDELLLKHNKVMLISLLLGTIGYGFLYFFGIELIHLWIGDKYVVDVNVFYFLLGFAFIHVWNHVSSVFVMATGLHREVSFSVAIEAFLNVALSIILLKYYGLMGVAMGTFFAHLLTNNWFATFWFYKNMSRLKKIKE
jgi:O-antigen/teichoic acid export membrane protein